MKHNSNKKRNGTTIWLLSLVIGFIMTTNAFANGDAFIEVTDAYVNAPPPSATSAAAYMTLINQSGRPIILSGVTSLAARKAMLHRSEVKNGMMMMHHINKLEIPAGGKVALSPGGLHIMLNQLKQSLKPGEHISLTLMFEDNKQLTVDVPIRDMRNQNSGD
jgi:copper(I)-binding protein